MIGFKGIQKTLSELATSSPASIFCATLSGTTTLPTDAIKGKTLRPTCLWDLIVPEKQVLVVGGSVCSFPNGAFHDLVRSKSPHEGTLMFQSLDSRPSVTAIQVSMAQGTRSNLLDPYQCSQRENCTQK